MEEFWASLTRQTELFDGGIVFTPLLFIIDILLILHFFIMWYYQYKKTGIKLDFWFFIIIILIFFPVLLMYPFNASEFNRYAVGKNIYQIQNYVDKAFLISITGYISMWFGRTFYSYFKLPFYSIQKGTFLLRGLIANNIKSNISIFFLSVVSFLLMGYVIYVQIREGEIFDPRAYFQAHGVVRPFYNATVFTYPLLITFLGIRVLRDEKKSWEVILFIGVLVFSVFLGTRRAIVEPLALMVVFYSIKNYSKVPIRNILFLAILLIFMLFLILYLRSEKGIVTSLDSFGRNLFYGDTFSDVRDFAWILSEWNYEFAFGNTYLAGIISFIPRALSDFRDTWSLGVYTNKFVGFSIENHPGLRPGLFGEAFFNFGYLGVVIIGTLAGYFLRGVDKSIKNSILKYNQLPSAYAFTLIWSIFSCLLFSVNFPILYIFLLINIFIGFLRQLIFSFNKKVLKA